MSTYTPLKHRYDMGLDETGLRLSLPMQDHESIDQYRQRLYKEVRDQRGPEEKSTVENLGMQVGLLNTLVFRIHLIEIDGVPLAEDPFIEITSTRMRLWTDYANDVLEKEYDLTDRTLGYFLGQIYDDLLGNAYFTVEVIDEDYEYRLSSNLMYTNSDSVSFGELTNASKSNKLKHENIKTIIGSPSLILTKEKPSVSAIVEQGDYHIDYVNGVVFMFGANAGSIGYTYRDFPFYIWWQPVHVVPFNDPDLDYILYDQIIDDDSFTEVQKKLSPEGARLMNKLLEIHGTEWGT